MLCRRGIFTNLVVVDVTADVARDMCRKEEQKRSALLIALTLLTAS